MIGTIERRLNKLVTAEDRAGQIIPTIIMGFKKTRRAIAEARKTPIIREYTQILIVQLEK
jgi:hypothetical protein